MLVEVCLIRAKEPLQIPYPRNFKGKKSVGLDHKEFHLSTLPRYVTEDEYQIAQDFVKKLQYSQEVQKTGAVQIGSDDPLIGKDQDYLDHVEEIAALPNTRLAPFGGERQTYERVLLIRERGYSGNGSQALPAS